MLFYELAIDDDKLRQGIVRVINSKQRKTPRVPLQEKSRDIQLGNSPIATERKPRVEHTSAKQSIKIFLR